jgi:acetylornithine deacetylase/succinyl-diaminopimelate desuccinylase-like protein
MTTQVLEIIDSMRDELIKLSLDLGNMETPSGREGVAGNYVYDWMTANGFMPERVGVFADRFNVVGRLRGSGGGKSLSFNSHLDTITRRGLRTTASTATRSSIVRGLWLAG